MNGVLQAVYPVWRFSKFPWPLWQMNSTIWNLWRWGHALRNLNSIHSKKWESLLIIHDSAPVIHVCLAPGILPESLNGDIKKKHRELFFVSLWWWYNYPKSQRLTVRSSASGLLNGITIRVNESLLLIFTKLSSKTFQKHFVKIISLSEIQMKWFPVEKGCIKT